MKIVGRVARRLRRGRAGAPPRQTPQQRFPQYQIGVGTYGPFEVKTFGNDGDLLIGNYCSFAEETTILLGGNHRIDWVTTYPFNVKDPLAQHLQGHPATKGAVRIGHDVWIGYRATILSGVTIGHGAVVGAGALVTRDVRPYAVVVGNPAREVRRRFPDDVVDGLLELEWWHWSADRIRDAYDSLLADDPSEFLSRFRDT